MMDDILISSMLFDLEFKFMLDTSINTAAKARAAGWLPKHTDDHCSFVPHYDEITAAFDTISRGANISIVAVFSAEVILNIHKILRGKISDVYKELRQRGAIAEKVLDI